jgi:hypothetical protein
VGSTKVKEKLSFRIKIIPNVRWFHWHPAIAFRSVGERRSRPGAPRAVVAHSSCPERTRLRLAAPVSPGARQGPVALFSDEGIGTIPLFATANLLSKFSPEEKEWWEYLDQIWGAAEAAGRTSATVLPAFMLRAQKESTGDDDTD